MLIEVALTKEIINESLPIHYKHTSFFQRFLPYITPFFLLVYAVVYVFIQPNGVYGWERYSYSIMFLGIAILFILWITYKRNSAGKRMLKLLGDRTHYEIEADENELITRLIDATYNQKWTVYPKAVIAKEMVLLYQQNKMFSIFHTSFFANNDFNQFKQLVRKHVHQVKEH